MHVYSSWHHYEFKKAQGLCVLREGAVSILTCNSILILIPKVCSYHLRTYSLQILLHKSKSEVAYILQVWRVNGSEKTFLSFSEQCKFYSGDCYIFQYTYPGENGDECLIGTWFGKKSVQVAVLCICHLLYLYM